MDDDLLFAISGLSPRSPIRVMEDSCHTLAKGCLESRNWKRVLLTDRKQNHIVLRGVLIMLEQEKATRKSKNAALAVLQVFCSTEEAILGSEADDLELAKRLTVVLIREMHVDDGGDGKTVQSWDVAAEVLSCFSRSTFGQSAAIIREVVSKEDRVWNVIHYIRNKFHADKTDSPSSLQLLALSLMENLAYADQDNSTMLASHLSNVLIQATTMEMTRETALRALTNIANDCIPAAAQLVSNGVMECVMKCLCLYLPLNVEISGLPAKDFDGALVALTVLGNLVEHSESGGSLALIPPHTSEEYITFLCSTYSNSLPVKAREELKDGDSSSTIEFGWTAEALILSSHVCLILGCLVRDSREASEIVLRLIPGGKNRGFSPLIQVLQGFLDFQSDAGVLTPQVEAMVREVGRHFSQATNRSMLPPSCFGPDLDHHKKRKELSSSSSSTTTTTTTTTTTSKTKTTIVRKNVKLTNGQ